MTLTSGLLVAPLTVGLVLILHGCTASMVPFLPPPDRTVVNPSVQNRAPATYWVTFSTRIRPGMTLPVTVHLMREGDTATVSVTLTNGSDHSIVFAQTSNVPVVAGKNLINLQIPSTLKRPHWRHYFSYVVQVVASGDVNFNRSETVSLDEKAFSIFVQTDKAIYKPGQTVKIRALAMNPDLTVLKEPMDIFIRDSLGNGIKRWTQLLDHGDSGVVETSLPTSTDPPLGKWEIEVTVGEYTEKKTFTIDKYVLPKFEAKVDVPKVVLTSGPGLQGKATAKYTFGKPLTGAKVTVTVQYDYFWQKENITKPVLTRHGTLDQNGEMDFSFPMSELEDLTRRNSHYKPGQRVYMNWRSVKVTAEVTDVRTRRTMEAESSVRFSKDPAKVEFLPLTPYNYKPGLRYTAYVKVTQPDGTLFPNFESINVTFNVTMFVPVVSPTTPPAPKARSLMVYPPPPPFYRPEKEVPLFVESKQLTANGFLSVDVNVPADSKRIAVKVEAMGVTARRSVQKAADRTGNYLQITGQEQSPKVGQLAKLQIRTTERVNRVFYQVYTKGLLIAESEATATDVEGQKFIVSFTVTSKMAPSCKVLAFYLRHDWEFVADSLSFKVDVASADQVSVSYNRQKVKPGEEVQMTVTAKPNSVVFLRAVDKSVQLLKSGNDITQEMVSQELAGYDFGGGFVGYWRYMFICGWPYPSQGEDAESIFRDANVAMLTDGFLYRKPYENPYYRAYGGPNVMMAAPSMDAQRSGGRALAASAPTESLAERVRTFFPETWLWDMIEIGPSGQLMTRSVVPDTITTWLTSAFAVHPLHGLSVIQQPAQLTTFKDVFVSLDLPYSAIRGEDLCLKSFGFNYLAQSTGMTMKMDTTPGIENIIVRNGRQERRSEVITRDLGQVGPNEVKETVFCFTPTLLGRLPVRVNLSTSALAADALQRSLLVEAEGTPRVKNIPVILDVEPGVLFQHNVPIVFPGDTVQGSQKITVSVAGDLLGPVFENIDDLLRMPYGCGEQNMLYFAPNVFLIDYLQRTGTYTPERAQKAENYMMIGYQKEIRYQHTDGSFSAFGNRKTNETGSMWLTAFVVKCFAQSMALQGEVVTIEPRILQRAVLWMVSQQRKDGSFPEPGTVFNKNMQGGSAKGEALTAYVLIALAETDKHFSQLSANDSLKLREALSRGRSYLEQQLTSLTDPYDIAIVTYALHITGSHLADQSFNILTSKAVRGSLSLHWERPKPKTPPRYYWQRQTDAINIEMTSYALLTYMNRNNVKGALPIVRWLTNQRGPQGGFISTQDTVVGLQALALVATSIYQPSSPAITVTVLWTIGGTEQRKVVTLDDSTRGLLQKVSVPVENNVLPSQVTIQASTTQHGSGSSFAVAEVSLGFNAVQDTSFGPFIMHTRVQPIDKSHFFLRIAASRIDGEGGMTVIDVGLLTGYEVDEDSPLYDIATAKTAELKGRHYIIYFDKIGRRQVTITLPMVVTSGIPLSPKPGVILIYDYYENAGGQQLAVKYSLSTRLSICSAEPTYEGCSRIGLSRGLDRFLRLF